MRCRKDSEFWSQLLKYLILLATLFVKMRFLERIVLYSKGPIHCYKQWLTLISYEFKMQASESLSSNQLGALHGSEL